MLAPKLVNPGLAFQWEKEEYAREERKLTIIGWHMLISEPQLLPLQSQWIGAPAQTYSCWPKVAVPPRCHVAL